MSAKYTKLGQLKGKFQHPFPHIFPIVHPHCRFTKDCVEKILRIYSKQLKGKK